MLNAIAGYDPLDSTSIPGETPDYTDGLSGGVKGLRIGVVPEYLGDGIDPGGRRFRESCDCGAGIARRNGRGGLPAAIS